MTNAIFFEIGMDDMNLVLSATNEIRNLRTQNAFLRECLESLSRAHNLLETENGELKKRVVILEGCGAVARSEIALLDKKLERSEKRVAMLNNTLEIERLEIGELKNKFAQAEQKAFDAENANRHREWRQTVDAPIPESVPVLVFNAAFGFAVIRREGDMLWCRNPETGLLSALDNSDIDWEWWRPLREPGKTALKTEYEKCLSAVCKVTAAAGEKLKEGLSKCQKCGGTRFHCGCIG